ncbi:MAG: GNAT family N-acetyltransferase [Pseudomonadaceae bacterium]|nr:GNAT family N-acetyltransferase [Pseudomonadaceae bacterium]
MPTRSLAPQLSRRVEEAALNAWPSLHQVLYDGWLLRFSRGFTKRANSIVPLYESTRAIAEKVRYCENLYARERLTTIFRLTSLPEQLALRQQLSDRGYTAFDLTHVLYLPLAELHEPETDFHRLDIDDWLSIYARMTGVDAATQQLHGLLLKGIRSECCFGAVKQDGRVLALGLAVLEEELVGLFDVVTDPNHRQQGHGRTLISALTGWGGRSGAQGAYLQMLADNRAASALYVSLGFSRLHSYEYLATT